MLRVSQMGRVVAASCAGRKNGLPGFGSKTWHFRLGGGQPQAWVWLWPQCGADVEGLSRPGEAKQGGRGDSCWAWGPGRPLLWLRAPEPTNLIWGK